ncbi:HAD family hydrolase [Gemella sp. zg-570]|nr:HAD family hydrolase [Gemella sp. zg-1178]QWQ39511.1 HAD family hydrolase [Gemella sp. zg-570]
MKVVVTDMDGTFLNDEKEISPNSKKVIEKLQEHGIKFLIATGRADIAVRNYYHDMGLNDVTIACNGSFIRNQATGEVIYENPFTDKEISIIHKKYLELTDGSVELHIYSPNYIYCDRISFNVARIKRVEEETNAKYKTPVCIEEDILSAIARNKDKCYKVMMSSKNHNLLEKIYEEVKKEFDLEGTFSATHFFDMVPKGTSKAEGIKRVAKYYNISVEDSVVFGDNLNDIEMLKVAGTAICPSNARDEIKKMCHLVIGNNNDFSVLKYLEEYVNKLGETTNEK